MLVLYHRPPTLPDLPLRPLALRVATHVSPRAGGGAAGRAAVSGARRGGGLAGGGDRDLDRLVDGRDIHRRVDGFAVDRLDIGDSPRVMLAIDPDVEAD